jgi:hypothetical protein
MKTFSALKAAVALAGLAIVAAGCADGYYDHDGYYHYYRHGYYDNDRHYRGDRDEDRYNRRWVCDADGDDCHWEYRH